MFSFSKIVLLFASLFSVSISFAGTSFDSFEGRYEIVKVLQDKSFLELEDKITIQSFAQSARIDIKNAKTSELTFSKLMTEREEYQGEGRWDVAKFIVEDGGFGWVGDAMYILLFPLEDGTIKLQISKHFWNSMYFTDEAIIRKLN